LNRAFPDADGKIYGNRPFGVFGGSSDSLLSGDCARIHGHNWEVVCAVSCPSIDEIGLSIDLKSIKEMLRNILSDLDHTHLNENPMLDGLPPTAEHIARMIYKSISFSLMEQKPECRISYIEVFEGPNASVRYEVD
jgi:6-pyruvoyltetrahydropterin/6-carboxytetrahydropterin synthase